jgi:hypothetical protein
MLSEPELSAMLELPVTPLVSAEPSHPEASLERPSAPTREVLMSSR